MTPASSLRVTPPRRFSRRVAQLGLLGFGLLAAARSLLGPAPAPNEAAGAIAALPWIAASTRQVLLEVSVGLLIAITLGITLGCVFQTRERSSSPLSGRWSAIANSIPAFLVVALLRARHGETLPFDLAIVVGVVNGLEAARWIREEWMKFETNSVARSVRAVGFDTRHVLRLFGPTLAEILPLVAARATSAIIGLQALLAFFHFNFGDVSTWGALLGETATRHVALDLSISFAIASVTALPVCVQILIETLTTGRAAKQL